MSVELSPQNVLGFQRPLTQTVKRTLNIHNPNPTAVAFKVKTTAPKQYCVRPNQGSLESGASMEVHIIFQPLPEDPPPHAKCKDKFLVQSTTIPADWTGSAQELLSLPQGKRENPFLEQKIRCAYLPAEDSAGNPNGIPEEAEEHSPVDHSRMDESRAGRGGTRWAARGREHDLLRFPNGGHTVWELDQAPKPTTRATPNPHATTTLPPQAAPAMHNTTFIVLPLHGIYSNAEGYGDANGNNHAGYNGNHNAGLAAGAGALGGAAVGTGAFSALNQQHHQNNNQTAAPVASRQIPSLSANDVQSAGAPTNVALERSLNATTGDSEQLNAALQEIQRLRAQLGGNQAQTTASDGPSVTGLRKRGGGVTDTSGANTQTAAKFATTEQPAAGVPVEIVAGLVFAVFVLTYLFF